MSVPDDPRRVRQGQTIYWDMKQSPKYWQEKVAQLQSALRPFADIADVWDDVCERKIRGTYLEVKFGDCIPDDPDPFYVARDLLELSE